MASLHHDIDEDAFMDGDGDLIEAPAPRKQRKTKRTTEDREAEEASQVARERFGFLFNYNTNAKKIKKKREDMTEEERNTADERTAKMMAGRIISAEAKGQSKKDGSPLYLSYMAALHKVVSQVPYMAQDEKVAAALALA